MVGTDGSAPLLFVDGNKSCIFEVLPDRSALAVKGEELDKLFSELLLSVFVCFHGNWHLFHLTAF